VGCSERGGARARTRRTKKGEDANGTTARKHGR